MNFRIRRYDPKDLDLIYHITLVTGLAGKDASPYHTDHKLLGHIWSAPYVVFEPELAFVAEDAEGVAGYALGTLDTRRFEKRCEADWWPKLRIAYPKSGEDGRTPHDRAAIDRFHNQPIGPDWVVDDYPAHMHLDILPRLQGKGVGRALFEAFATAARAANVTKIHVGTDPSNESGQGFWKAVGFRPPPEPNDGSGVFVIDLS